MALGQGDKGKLHVHGEVAGGSSVPENTKNVIEEKLG